MVKIRNRDLKPGGNPATQADIVRLENLIAKTEPVDITPLEKIIRSNSEEMEALRVQVASLRNSASSEDYVFEIERRKDQRIERVIARKATSTALGGVN